MDLKRFKRAHKHEHLALLPNFVNCHFTSLWFYVKLKPDIIMVNLCASICTLTVLPEGVDNVLSSFGPSLTFSFSFSS